MECYVADGYWVDGYTEQDVCGITPTAPRGDDAFRTSGHRERFWQSKAEEQLASLIDRAEQAIGEPRKARREVADAFSLVEWEALPQAPKMREMLAAIVAPQPDYTEIAALILVIRGEIEAERKTRRRKRDMEALLLLA